MRKVIWGFWGLGILAIGIFPWLFNPLWRRFEGWSQMFLTHHTFRQAAWWWRIDTAVHVTAVLALLLWLEFGRRIWGPSLSPIWGPVAVASIVISDETLQLFDRERSFSLSDVLPGVIVCVIWVLVAAFRAWQLKRSIH